MKKLFTLLTPVVLLLLWGNTAYASKWRVNSNQNIDAHFHSIGEACHSSSVQSGDTLYVEGSSFSYGDVTLNKSLVLIGPGYFLHDNENTSAFPLEAQFRNFKVTEEAAHSVIMGLSIYGTFYLGSSNIALSRNLIQYLSIGHNGTSHISASNCLISQNYIDGEVYINSKPADGIIITNNIIKGNLSAYYANYSRSQSAVIARYNYVGEYIMLNNSIIEYNIVKGHLNSMQVASATNTSILETTSKGSCHNRITANFCSWENGRENSVNWQRVFVAKVPKIDREFEFSQNPFQGNIDIKKLGPFGGKSPYVLSGLPPVPVIYHAEIAPVGTKKEGLSVFLQIKTQD
ncbi:hypothetical protein [Algivirga pacifica]|uniref:Right handed beta helix domain-containing protein n=1 Tax=Algivirga pacifica TaxID=1162670 RepID=A0ABP9DC95_9BACT